MTKYKVTCLKCGESDVVTIDENDHQVWDYGKKLLTNLLSMRWRRDMKWGAECKCGNDNRLAASEQADFNTLVQGDASSIQKIADSLQLPDSKQFKMEQI